MTSALPTHDPTEPPPRPRPRAGGRGLSPFWVSAWPLVLLAVPLGGCPTLGQFRDLESRFITLEKQQQNLSDEGDQVEERLSNLHAALQREGGDLRESGASLESRLEALDLAVRKLQGKDEELDYQLGQVRVRLDALVEALDDRFGLSASLLPAELPKDPEKLMSEGNARMDRGLFRVARAIFRRLIKDHPRHDLAARAQLRIGESFAREQKFDAALRELTRMEGRYGKTPEMAEAYLMVGAILEQQGSCAKARAVYQVFLKRAGKHDRRDAITKRVREMKADRSCK